MGFRPTFDVQHKRAEDPLVDKKIGNAYRNVEYVAQHMDEILALTPKGYEDRYVEGSLGLIGETTTIPLPADISISTVRKSEVQIRSIQGQIYSQVDGVFTASVGSTGLTITLKADAPYLLQNSLVMWTITYGVADA
jgi:hypothetical protein